MNSAFYDDAKSGAIDAGWLVFGGQSSLVGVAENV